MSGFRAKRRLGELSRGLFRRIFLHLEQATVEMRASVASRPLTEEKPDRPRSARSRRALARRARSPNGEIDTYRYER